MVTSTDVWGSVVKAVGGDAVSVTALIDSPAKDPHDYETNSLDAAKISKAKLVVYNGNGYDDFFAKAVAAVGRNQKRLVAFDVSGKQKSSNTNEHVFYDLPTVKQVADAVAAQLSKLNGARKDTFTANATKFNAQIDGLADTAKQIGAMHPNQSVVATEPVADYLLELAGVKDVTPEAFEEAVEADQDIPAQAAADVHSLISGRKVAALINNAQTETGTTNELKAAAARAGVP
ncbi:MAG: metal ABC transporter solute-binding protein, Zn/Mn family, partial [Mycobacteriales bacterium]